MVEVKVFLDGKMVRHTESDYAVVFSGSEKGDGIGICGEFSMSDFATTLAYCTVECIDAVSREIGIEDFDRYMIIRTISEGIKKRGREKR